MKCPICGTENRYDATVCENCSASLIESPPADSIDLDRFAPAYSDPLNSLEKTPAEEPAEDNSGSFAEKAKEILKKIWSYIVLGSRKCAEMFRNLFGRLGEWFSAAWKWISAKIKGEDYTAGTEKPQRNASDDGDDDGETFRKTILAIILAVVGIIALFALSFCGACSSCSCSSCAGDSVTGTWVRYDDQLDGYNASDFIIELTADGTVMQYGQPAGSYKVAEDGTISLTINQMAYTASMDKDAENMDIYLENSTYAGLCLAKLSDSTGLSAEELAAAYPDE